MWIETNIRTKYEIKELLYEDLLHRNMNIRVSTLSNEDKKKALEESEKKFLLDKLNIDRKKETGNFLNIMLVFIVIVILTIITIGGFLIWWIFVTIISAYLNIAYRSSINYDRFKFQAAATWGPLYIFKAHKYKF